MSGEELPIGGFNDGVVGLKVDEKIISSEVPVGDKFVCNTGAIGVDELAVCVFISTELVGSVIVSEDFIGVAELVSTLCLEVEIVNEEASLVVIE